MARSAFGYYSEDNIIYFSLDSKSDRVDKKK